MDRDTFSHIRLWCPRPFGTYSQNKARSAGSGASSGGTRGRPGSPSLCKAEPSAVGRRSPEGGGDEGQAMVVVGEQGENVAVEQDDDAGSENTPPGPDLPSTPLTTSPTPVPSSPPPSPPSSGAQMEDGRVLLDTWYVIKPGNTKEKIAFFVAHQFSGAGLQRPSAMKVKGNWATDCSKAKRRRRCSSYDPPTRPLASSDPQPDETLVDGGVSETDLLSVAEMVALVEQRTAMALQGMVASQGHQQTGHQLPTSQGPPHQHTLLRSSVSDPNPMVFSLEGPDSQPSAEHDGSSSPIQTDQEQDEEPCKVADAIAHFESQNLENQLRLASGSTSLTDSSSDRVRGHGRGGEPGVCNAVTPPPPSQCHGEVRIAFRVSSLDSRSQSEPAGRPRCMFMSCGGGASQAGARAKEKITCDLYQLVSPSSRDPSGLLLTAAKPEGDDAYRPDRQTCGSPEPGQELPKAEKKGVGRERVTGFHVEVVVTGAVDQCVFYGKDSTENVQEETVCFAMPGGGAGSSCSPDPTSDDPPPGQLFFLQPPRGPEEDGKGTGGSGMCSLDGGGGGPGSLVAVGPGERAVRPDSPRAGSAAADDCSDPSLCRLYRHVSHDFLEIRFQIQRLLEPRQYMLLLPHHIMVNIFSYLPTRALAALKCTCHDFRALIETYGVRAVDSRWNQDPQYRDDPCKQCKRQYERGDVSLCRWHPKPYHHDLPYGRSYWMCCRRTDKDTPGCRVGLHDNNWVQQPADGSQSVRAKREERREERREEAR
ncbi:F-box only protein 46 [Merluccius polli]|uniref:F-box only protein 46 n=1 Tax=Merluccius polli TaxID=89951 RepID=A0AA47NAA7_MERPO|nr:F-box only protein 46 [Merluccius polli]